MRKQRSFSITFFLTVAVFIQFGGSLAFARTNHSVDASIFYSTPFMGEQNVDRGTLTELIDAYLRLKDALVNDERKQAKKAAKHMRTVFQNVDSSHLTSDELATFKDITEDADEQLEHIQKSKIAHQREHFSNLSEDIIDLISALGADRKLYIYHCKKCVEGEPASWLSDTSEVNNPYYGKKNLHQGELLQIIDL